LLSFALAGLLLRFVSISPATIGFSLLLCLLGACFGISYLRTWKRVYRNLVLAGLIVGVTLVFLAMLLPSR
jgi:hypothetical protein